MHEKKFTYRDKINQLGIAIADALDVKPGDLLNFADDSEQLNNKK